MIRLVTDSSSTYSMKDALSKGFFANPLEITIDDESFKDFEDITSLEILEKIKKGKIPKTSQPNIGALLDIFEEYPNDEFIYISIANGLSGGYEAAISCKNMSSHPERIHVINSKTVWGPQKYLVDYAFRLIEEGFSFEEIVKKVNELIETSTSYLVPFDFGFLKRGGRLSEAAYLITSAIKLNPSVKLSKDGRRLDKFSIQRTPKKTFSLIAKSLKEIDKIEDDYVIIISHAFAEKEVLNMILEIFRESFPHNKIEVLPLSPTMITHGGPGCVSIQTIKNI